MADFFVSTDGSNGNAGTSAGAAWATPEFASDAARGLGAGDVVRFRAGDRFTGVNVSIDYGGSVGNPVIWSRYGDSSDPNPVIEGLPDQGAGGSDVVSTTQDYVRLEHLKITQGRDGWRAESGAIGPEIAHCDVSGTFRYGVAYMGSGGSGGLVDDCKIHDTGNDGFHADTHHGITIRNSRIRNAGSPGTTEVDGIHLVDCYDTFSDIHDNIVEGTFQRGAISCTTGDADVGSRANVFRNFCTSGLQGTIICRGQGLPFDASPEATTVNAYSNVLETSESGLGAAIESGSGMRSILGGNLTAYNNTVVNFRNTLNVSANFFCDTDSRLVMRNNISFCTTTTGLHVAAIGLPTVDIDYNVYFPDDAPLSGIQIAGRFFFGLAASRFEAWRTVSGQDSNTVAQDPLLRHERKGTAIARALLSGSPAIGAGEDLSGTLTYDLLNRTRSVPFDIGALQD